MALPQLLLLGCAAPWRRTIRLFYRYWCQRQYWVKSEAGPGSPEQFNIWLRFCLFIEQPMAKAAGRSISLRVRPTLYCYFWLFFFPVIGIFIGIAFCILLSQWLERVESSNSVIKHSPRRSTLLVAVSKITFLSWSCSKKGVETIAKSARKKQEQMAVYNDTRANRMDSIRIKSKNNCCAAFNFSVERNLCYSSCYTISITGIGKKKVVSRLYRNDGRNSKRDSVREKPQIDVTWHKKSIYYVTTLLHIIAL